MSKRIVPQANRILRFVDDEADVTDIDLAIIQAFVAGEVHNPNEVLLALCRYVLAHMT